MNIVFMLLPMALLFAACSIAGYIWAASKGQYEDLETPAHRMLLEDEVRG